MTNSVDGTVASSRTAGSGVVEDVARRAGRCGNPGLLAAAAGYVGGVTLSTPHASAGWDAPHPGQSAQLWNPVRR